MAKWLPSFALSVLLTQTMQTMAAILPYRKVVYIFSVKPKFSYFRYYFVHPALSVLEFCTSEVTVAKRLYPDDILLNAVMMCYSAACLLMLVTS